MSQLPDYLNKGGGKLRSPPAGYIEPENIVIRLDLDENGMRELNGFLIDNLNVKGGDWNYHRKLDTMLYTVPNINKRDMESIVAIIKLKEKSITQEEKLNDFETAIEIILGHIRKANKEPELKVDKFEYPLPLLGCPTDKDTLLIIKCDTYEEMNRMRGYINKSKHRRTANVYANMEFHNKIIVVSVYSHFNVNRMRRLVNAAHYKHQRFIKRHKATTNNGGNSDES